jgi:ABC-type lipoprotein export system ATPase subunit
VAIPEVLRTDGDTVLEAWDLYHIYQERGVETVALRGTNLTMAKGSWTSVMGPSGSGKTTLLQILAGLIRPSAGELRVEGTDLMRLGPVERSEMRRRRLGVLLQRDNLHPLLDVASNVALPLRLDGRSRAEARPRVDELIARLGLEDRRHARPTQLSGGEAQRAALAVALAPSPVVVLADEPTGELDRTTAGQVLDLLAEARDRDGVAVLTVTHDPAVDRRADRRYRMRDGRLRDA